MGKQNVNLKAGTVRSKVDKFLRTIGFDGIGTFSKPGIVESSIENGVLTLTAVMYVYPGDNGNHKRYAKLDFNKAVSALKKIQKEFGGKLLMTDKHDHHYYGGRLASTCYKRSLKIVSRVK